MNCPDGRSVAVVSMLAMSRPCPSSVNKNWPLVETLAIVNFPNTVWAGTHCFRKRRRSSTRGERSERCLQ